MHKKLISKPFQRVIALAMTLVLFISCSSLTTNASAARIQTKTLYNLIKDAYYANDQIASGILSSGALLNDSSITICYPDSSDALLSMEDAILTANTYSSTYKGLFWTPYKYTFNSASGTFNGGATAQISDLGLVHADVEYRLTLTDIGGEVVQLPATLMAEAKNQLYVLDKLINSEDPYMNHMSKLNKTTVNLLGVAVAPNDPLKIGSIHSDSGKNLALKTCFSNIAKDLLKTCYTDDSKNLTIYNLLTAYIAEKDAGAGLRLAYYYKNNDAFLTEINQFSAYLTEMLRDDPAANLTREDKITGLENLSVAAAAKGVKLGEYVELIPELEQKMATVQRMLTKHNASIDVDSSDLVALTAILESGKSVTKYSGQVTLNKTVSADLCNHYYDDNKDPECNACGAIRTVSPDNTGSDDAGSDDTGFDDTSSDNTSSDDTGSDDTGSGHIPVIIETNNVSTVTQFNNRVSKAEPGDKIKLTNTVTMTEDIQIDCAIFISSADKLNDTGHVLKLKDTNAKITADSALNVASALDGYVPVKATDSYTYALVEASAPKTSGEVAGSKSETLDDSRYLFLDLNPSKGMTLDAFRMNAEFDQLANYTVTISIKGNDGSSLIKTADRLVVTARNSDGKVVAQITYVVIVMGDTNCNGKVNTSDAAVTKNISMGKESSLEARMAADVNFSGTLEEPRVNSSDVSFSMAKWFAWDLNQYVSNLK